MLADVTIDAREAAAPRRRPGGWMDLRDHTDEIVWAATRAPSYRNTQPWLFRVAARQVEVSADRSRSCPAADPEGRELFLGLGAAVFGVRLAMSRLRVRSVVGLSRDHAHPDLAAVVVAAGHAHAPDEDDRLYDQLGRRRTIWTPFTDEPFRSNSRSSSRRGTEFQGVVTVTFLNHRVLDGLVAFRTADGTKLGAATEGSVVAFEVDRYDADSHTGWSVLIKGRAELLDESTLQIRLLTAGLRPWRNRVPRPDWVVIRPDTVTGRRL